VICVDSATTSHVAGAAGCMCAPPTCSAMSPPEEALEYCAAIMQMYREEAAYLDRLFKWSRRLAGAAAQKNLRDPDAAGALRPFHAVAALARRDPGRTRRSKEPARIHAARRAVADCAPPPNDDCRGFSDGREQHFWFDCGPISGIPLRGARTVRTPHRDIAVFRREQRDFRAGEQVPAPGRPLSEGIVHGARSRARCTIGSSISKAGGDRRDQAARGNFR